jgi:hypothetical protein
MEWGTPGGKSHKSHSPRSLTKLLSSWSTAVRRAFPFSIMAYSASTCQWSSRTSPAVSLISTPAMVVEIGTSRAVTCRVQPPAVNSLVGEGERILERPHRSAVCAGDHSEFGFCRFWGRGSLSFGVLWLACCCSCGAATAQVAAARAAAPNPNLFRLLLVHLPC